MQGENSVVLLPTIVAAAYKGHMMCCGVFARWRGWVLLKVGSLPPCGSDSNQTFYTPLSFRPSMHPR